MPEKVARRDVAADPSLFEGTFRWAEGTEFELLGAFPAERVPVLHSFEIYMAMRGVAEVTPQMLDALSFPLSLCCALKKTKAALIPSDTIHVIIAGASIKAEQRILHETNYWEEIPNLLPDKKWAFHFVGPDVREVHRTADITYCGGCGASAQQGKGSLPRCTACRHVAYCNAACQKAHWKKHKADCKDRNVLRLTHNMTATCFRGGVKQYIEKACLPPDSTVVFGCNTGCGSGNPELMGSWAVDLIHLVERDFLCIMSCANTWGDLRGELLLLESSLRARVTMAPSSNPFKGTTVAQSQEPDESSGLRKWFCANYCMYAFRGHTSEVPPLEAVVEHIAQLAPVICSFAVTPEAP